MAATPSILVKKQPSYRGVTKLWSNRYHFLGGTPASDADWHTLMDAVTAAEKAIYNGQVTIIEAVGYAAGSDVPISSKTYSLTGTMATPGGSAQMLEVCGLVRWPTDVRTKKNHPIYLFSYIHGVYSDSTFFDGSLHATQKAAILTYATHWVTGFTDGALTYNRAGPNGAAGLTPTVETYTTVHTFPR